MFPEQAIEMARADAQPCRQRIDARAVERAVTDQPHGTMHRRARALPGGENGAVSGRQRRHGR